MKAHRPDALNPRNFVLVEELDFNYSSDGRSTRRQSTDKYESRVLAENESVYLAQSEWKTNGRFVLMARDLVETEETMVQHCFIVFKDGYWHILNSLLCWLLKAIP